MEACGERRKTKITCAEKIRTFRAAAGLSQSELATQAGYPLQEIEAFEAGHDPKVIDLMRIAAALKKQGLKIGTFDLFEDSVKDAPRRREEGETRE